MMDLKQLESRLTTPHLMYVVPVVVLLVLRPGDLPTVPAHDLPGLDVVLPQVVPEVVEVLEAAAALHTDGLVARDGLEVGHELLDGAVSEGALATLEQGVTSSLPSPLLPLCCFSFLQHQGRVCFTIFYCQQVALL